MPVIAMPTSIRREGMYVVLEWRVTGQAPMPVGVLLLDPSTGRTWLKMRDRIPSDELDAEVFAGMERELRGLLAGHSSEEFWTYIEDHCGNTLTASPRQTVSVDAFTRVLSQLYEEHVEPAPIRRFETHLPLYSLRAAAGSLGEEMAAEEEDWVPAPEGMHLSPDMFVAHVIGRSMEPRIPDGSLNLFKLKPAGSRQGRILLIERFGITDETARYTVKRYTSQKAQRGDEWEHTRIRLEPLNPEFDAWDVGPEEFAVVAEWIRVIE